MEREGHSEVGERPTDKYATTSWPSAAAEQSPQPGPSNLLQLLQLQSGQPGYNWQLQLQLQDTVGEGRKH